jgi:hypothetical protein
VRKGSLSAQLYATSRGHANVVFMENDIYKEIVALEIVDKDEVPISCDEAMSRRHANT